MSEGLQDIKSQKGGKLHVCNFRRAETRSTSTRSRRQRKLMIPFVLGKELKSDPEVVAGYKKTKLFFLRLAGMYPDVSPKGYSIFFFYVNLIYTQFAYYLISYTLALYYSVVWNDMDLMAEDIEFLCFTAFYCYSGTNAIVNRKKLDSLLKYVGRGFYQYHRPQTTEEKEITERSIYRENKVSRFYAAYVSAYLAYFVVFQPVKLVVDTGTITSVLDNASVPVNKMLPLRVWTPYDSSVPFNFVLGSISQVVAACMLMAIMVGVDISFVTLMTQLCNQFKLLNESVKSIYERAAYMFGQEPDKRGTDLFSRPEFQRCMYKCLVENIEHHKVLITFRNELQSFFGLWLLVVFVGSGLTICSSAYLLSTASDQGEQNILTSLSKVLLFFESLMTVLFYCYYSEELSTETIKFRHALYNCPWIHCSESFKKTLHITLTCTQRHLQMTAAGMIPASLATYSDVLKTSYSYFNLMRASTSHKS